MRLTTAATRWGVSLAVLTLVTAGAAWQLSSGSIFSPGPLKGPTPDGSPIGGVASHADLDRRCEACHAPPFSHVTMSARCLDCHEDIRAELGDSGALHGALDGTQACLGCHTEHAGRTASLTRFEGSGVAHTRFGFSLVAHRRTAGGRAFVCTDCHGGRGFRFEASRCVACHRDYQADFVERHVRTWGADCRACHEGSDRFSAGRFSHDSTPFPLTARHAQSKCGDCHAGSATLAAFGFAPRDCVGCHRPDDPHHGAFGTDCSACHTADSWKNARFDHTFPLSHGEGGRIPCRTCHERPQNWKSYTCYGCHEHTPERIQRKHADEGVARNLEDCVRCHATGREHEGEGHEGGRDHEDD